MGYTEVYKEIYEALQKDSIPNQNLIPHPHPLFL